MEEKRLIDQTFWTQKNIRMPEQAQKIINFIMTRDDGFLPTYWYGGIVTGRKYKKVADYTLEKMVHAFTLDFNYVVFTNVYQSGKNQCVYEFNFTITLAKKFCVLALGVTDEYFTSDEQIKHFVDIAKGYASLIDPMYGFIHDNSDRIEEGNGTAIDIINMIPDVYWCNYFGKYYIDRIGREKLLAFDSYKTETTPNDDIVIFTSASPLNPDSREDRKAQKRLKSYLKDYIGVIRG